jgi:hypothetical protein
VKARGDFICVRRVHEDDAAPTKTTTHHART